MVAAEVGVVAASGMGAIETVIQNQALLQALAVCVLVCVCVCACMCVCVLAKGPSFVGCKQPRET